MISDLVAFLGSQAAITGLVSTRIYPLPLPQKATLPSLTYTLVSATRTYSLDLVATDLHKARSRVQIDSWAETEKGAHQLARAVRLALSGFYGSMAGTQVHFIQLDDERDMFESQAGVVGLYRVIQDHIISHLED